jgi:hypothetical protein
MGLSELNRGKRMDNNAENAPVITLNGFSPYPGVDAEVWERYTKWSTEVYSPLMLKSPSRKGIDTYQITQGNPLYPYFLRIHHHESLASQRDTLGTSEQTAVSNDVINWRQRHVIDFVWSAVYRLVRSWRSGPNPLGEKLDTRIQNSPFLNLEAFRLAAEDREKYQKWFSEYAVNIFIPLFMKQPGVKGYDHYQFAGLGPAESNREFEYPPHFTFTHFENRLAFNRFETSPELTTCQKTLRSLFPNGLNYRWYVQYVLTASLRK